MSRKLVDFVCPECGHEREELVTDGQVIICNEHGGGVIMERKVSSPGLVRGGISRPGFKRREK